MGATPELGCTLGNRRRSIGSLYIDREFVYTGEPLTAMIQDRSGVCIWIGKGRERKGRERKGREREGKEREEGKGKEGKGKGREREGKEREEGKGREAKGSR